MVLKKDNSLYCSKKGQEEIMGFMLVVVFVMLIGMAFLFFMTPKQEERQDLELSNLLYAWESTSVENETVKDMIKECELRECNLESAVSVLEDAIDYRYGETINGYYLNITGEADHYYSSGNLSGSSKEASIDIDKSPVKLKVYYP